MSHTAAPPSNVPSVQGHTSRRAQQRVSSEQTADTSIPTFLTLMKALQTTGRHIHWYCLLMFAQAQRELALQHMSVSKCKEKNLLCTHTPRDHCLGADLFLTISLCFLNRENINNTATHKIGLYKNSSVTVCLIDETCKGKR